MGSMYLREENQYLIVFPAFRIDYRVMRQEPYSLNIVRTVHSSVVVRREKFLCFFNQYCSSALKQQNKTLKVDNKL